MNNCKSTEELYPRPVLNYLLLPLKVTLECQLTGRKLDFHPSERSEALRDQLLRGPNFFLVSPMFPKEALVCGLQLPLRQSTCQFLEVLLHRLCMILQSQV